MTARPARFGAVDRTTRVIVRRSDGPDYMYWSGLLGEGIQHLTEGIGCGLDPLLGWRPADPLACVRIPRPEDLLRVAALDEATSQLLGNDWIAALEAAYLATSEGWERGRPVTVEEWAATHGATSGAGERRRIRRVGGPR
jgi:hypothetical protein